MKITKQDNNTVIELETAGGFSTFQMGIGNHRQWQRHPETQELAKYFSENGKSEYVSVSYKGNFIRLRN